MQELPFSESLVHKQLAWETAAHRFDGRTDSPSVVANNILSSILLFGLIAVARALLSLGRNLSLADYKKK